MSQQENVTVTLAAISMGTAVVTSVTFNALIVSVASFVNPLWLNTMSLS